MSKKESNPLPPKNAVKPPPPPAPPKKFLEWHECKCISIIDQKAKCIGIVDKKL